MLKKVGWVSVALMAAACSGGGGGGETAIAGPNGMPPSTNANTAPSVMTRQVSGQPGTAISATIAVTDPDGDTTTLTMVSGPEWLSLTPNGQLSGTPSMDDLGTFDLVVEVSDGEDTSRATISVNVFTDPIEQALRTGDYTFITEHSETDVPSVLLDEIAKARDRKHDALNEIFQLNADGSVGDVSLTAVSWAPNMFSASHFPAVYPYSTPLLTSNDSAYPPNVDIRHNYAVIGELDATKYTVLGYSPLRGPYREDIQIHKVMKNTINWMVNSDTSENLNVVLAHIKFEQEEDRIRSWLDTAYPVGLTYNDRGSCDGDRFRDCITEDTDLMIMFQEYSTDEQAAALVGEIEQAMSDGIPLLIVVKYNEDTVFGTTLLNLLGGLKRRVTYPRTTRISDFSPHEFVYDWEPQFVRATEALVNNIEGETLDYDLSICTSNLACPENEAFSSEVSQALMALPRLVDDFDINQVDPFVSPYKNRFVAALLLTGDYYRSLTSFPMPKATTPSNDIIRALFGENTAIIYRTFNPVMPDMGTYSRSEFDQSLLGDEVVNLVSRAPYATSGVYALPGETVAVTRKDHDRASTKVRMHSLSEDSGQPFLTVGDTEYARPTGVSSISMELGNGETIEFTSPYGGPIHIEFDNSDSNVELAFKNVAKHPVWRAPEDSETFQIDLAADEFDWAEFVTPYFEIHSSAEKMRETLTQYSGPRTLAEMTNTYLRDWPIWLDGRTGDGVRDNPDLVAFQDQHAIPKHTADMPYQHIVVGQDYCDAACGDNPYESAGAFDPLSYSHQQFLAEKMARRTYIGRGPKDASLADLYVVHSYYRHHQDTGDTAPNCPELRHQELYELVQAAHASGDPGLFIANRDLAASDRLNAVYIQLFAALENQSAFNDGWALWPRLSTISRTYSKTFNSNVDWPEYAQRIGFGSKSHSEVSSWGADANHLIMLSWAAQRDLTAYFDMWGFEISDGARAHIAGLNLPPLEPAFYAIPATGHCTSLAHPELPIDGTSVWPN